MTPFYDLSLRGRALRLRRLGMEALKQYDLDVRRVRSLAQEMNAIFRLDLADGEKLALRVCVGGDIAHTADEIRAEMAWLHALAEETDLIVPRPVPARNGEFVVTASTPDVPEPRQCVIFSWVPGRNLADALTLENIRKQGAFMAALHEHAAGFALPDGSQINTFDRFYPYNEAFIVLDQDDSLLPPDRRALFEAVIRQAEADIAHLKAAEAPRLLHNDLHQWNMRVTRGRLAAIDFEDLVLGWPVQDIATTLYYYHGYPQYRERAAAFRQGYESVRPWPEDTPGEAALWLAVRAVGLANFVLHDPAPEWQALIPAFFRRTEARVRALVEDAPFLERDYPLRGEAGA
jgi:Ser/Thr protein kinase RdoA (MazF antagonist)